MQNIVNLKNKNLPRAQVSPVLPTIESTVIEWTAHEFEKKEKTSSWFTVQKIITLIFLITAIILKNYTFTIVVLMASLCVYIYARKEPKEINLSISHRGISINNKLYPYNELKSFWIFYDPPRLKQLSFQSKKILTSYIQMPLNNQNPNQLRSFLLKYLPEAEQEESLVDIFSDKIGF